MKQATVVAEGIGWPEGPRWHDGKLWFSDVFGRRAVNTLDPNGTLTAVAQIAGAPSGLGWSPDGDLLVVSMFDRQLLRVVDGEATVHADMSAFTTATNDMVVTPDGTCYAGDNGFRLGEDPPEPGQIIKVTPAGDASVVARDLWFPNGMAITPDRSTLIVAESFGGRVSQFPIGDDGELGERETFHAFDDLGWMDDLEAVMQRPALPDGISLNVDGAIWVGNPNKTEVTCVTSSGEVVDRVGLSQIGIACMLGGPARRTLYVCTGDVSAMDGEIGKIEVCEVDVPGAGYPAAA